MTAILRTATYACVGTAASVAALAQPLPAGVDACRALIQQQSEQPRNGPAEASRLGDVCPELADAINAGVWGEAIADVWAEDLGIDAFMALTDLVPVYAASSPGTVISTETLDAVLEEVRVQVPQPTLSLWERLTRWLEERLGPRPDADGGAIENWLANLSLPERLIRYLLIGLGLMLVVATGLIVWNELRASGVLGARGAKERDTGADAELRPERERVCSIAELRRAPLVRQPELLFALVLDVLRRRARIPDSATHREVAGAAGVLSETERRAFGVVLAAAERTTFGAWRPGPAELAPVLASGEMLLRDPAGERVEP